MYSRRKSPAERQIGVHSLQLGERGLRLLDPAELGKAGDDIAQTGRPVAIERPGPPPDFDGFVIMAQLVMSAGEGRQAR